MTQEVDKGKPKTFNILCLDGGGIRGAFSARLLQRMSETYGLNPNDYFDLIVGTSTGSIVAALLAAGKTPTEIYGFYENEAGSAFALKNRWSVFGAVTSRYNRSHLKTALDKQFGETTLGEVTRPLIIPATDIGNGCVHVLKSAYRPDLVRDGTVRLTDAVLASCAAPQYFDPHKVDSFLLADGGLWSNNPVLVGITEALSHFKVPREHIKVLSIGTGTGKKKYDVPGGARVGAWGLLTGWKLTRLIALMLNLQQASCANVAQLLIAQEQYLRLDFETETALALDQPGIIPTLKSRADHLFTHNNKAIASFING